MEKTDEFRGLGNISDEWSDLKTHPSPLYYILNSHVDYVSSSLWISMMFANLTLWITETLMQDFSSVQYYPAWVFNLEHYSFHFVIYLFFILFYQHNEQKRKVNNFF